MATLPGPAAEEVPQPIDLGDTSLYVNRELSWLDFNDRVLAEASDPRNPLLERVRFLAITSSNLDEFYSKRVAWLKQLLRTNPGHRTVDGLTIAEQSKLVGVRCADQRHEIEVCWHSILVPALERRGVRIVTFASLDPATQASLTEYFMSSVYPVLTPLVVDPAHPFPFISANSLSLALWVREPRTGAHRFARVKVPQNRPRFIDAGEMRFVLIEDLIAAHFDVLFPGVEIVEHRMLRVLRSIELGTPGEAAEDLLELIEREVRRRRLAEAVNVEVTGALTSDREELLLEELDLSEDDVVSCAGPLGLVDLHQIAGLPIADATFPLVTPAVPPAFADLADVADRSAFFAALQTDDMLVHHPYESFDATVARFIEAASRDPQVLAIKHTTYRTSPDSPILQSLIEASTRGKQVAVLVELTARLDEENNIEWARRLEEAGIHVGYGDPGRKIHSKITLVVREETSGVVMYGHIGTGNYNSRTARVYTDLGLFTSDATICGDLLRVFNNLTGVSEGFDTSELLVAPTNLRQRLEWRVEREIAFAQAGRPARVIFQMNALEDHDFIRLLYRAGQAGVHVDLIVRGICRLRPGVAGLSERIRVASVIGRFLEHSRAYYFENDGDPEVFIGSADLMKRNLDERIEVLTPIKRPSLRDGLVRTLDMLLADPRQTWRLVDRAWHRDSTVLGLGVQERLSAMAPFTAS